MDKIIKEITILKSSNLLNALRQMDKVYRKLLIVLDTNGEFSSLVSIGDIQRAIIRNLSLETKIAKIVRQNITIAKIGEDLEQVKERMKTYRIEFMPVVDKNNKVIKVIFWEDLFEAKRSVPQLNLPVVIMAGGKGTRMQPLTNIIPKPLIPVKEKTIVEDIMDRFVEYGCHQFYLSVNYKADMIQFYFNTLNNPNYQIEYIREDKPKGTAGSLSLLKGKIQKTFFVSNCDILIDQDYSEILNYHRNNNNDITVVASLKHIPVAYGTIETGDNGQLLELIEKPELTFKINSGMYILEPSVLKEIPDNDFFHITDLIEKIKQSGGKVGVFPVSENSWKDIGTWNEYLQNIKMND